MPNAPSIGLLLAALLASCAGDPGPTDTTPDPPTLPTGETGVDPIDTGTPLAAPLELCVNEFMPDNARSWQDDTGAWPDWIELHNPGTAAVDLLGWALTDDRGDRRKHVFTTSQVVPAGGFVVLAADGSPELGPQHLSFSLAAEGEEVALFRADGSAEIITYGAVVSDLAVVRDTDCGPIEDWRHAFAGSPGASNPAP